MKQKLICSMFVFFLMISTAIAQKRNLTGTVISGDDNMPIPTVSVLVKGTNTGTQTDGNGKYSISVSEGATLVFSFMGYSNREVTVGTKNVINVTLTSDVKKLEEVVVIGYGTQRKKDVTGALSSVSAKDFKDQPVTSVSQVLQGRAAGVQVMSNAGSPGGDVSIRIRGSNSIKGDNNPLYVIDGFVGADFSSINPNDIANLEVLKDASATAIYGSRGANGVVLITTKRGKKGVTQVEFTSRFTTGQVIKKLNLLNAVDFATTVNANEAAIGKSPRYTQAEIDQFRLNGGTDWQDELFRISSGQEYMLNVSGGGDKTTFYIGANHLNQQGIIINSGFKRSSIRVNLNSELSKNLSLYMNTFATRQERTNTDGNGGKNSPVTQAIGWSPTVPVRDANGGFTISDPVSSIAPNPIALMLDKESINTNTMGNMLLGLKYKIADGLTLDVSGAANYTNTRGFGYTGRTVSPTVGQASASQNTNEGISLQNTNNLTYTHTFNDVHRLTATAVMEIQRYKATGFTANANNLTFPELKYYNLSQAATFATSSSYTNYGLVSYLGRVNYSYNDKYLLTASVRRDGSSKFQEGNQYSVFPSVGLGWKLSDEEFIKKMDVFDNLKLRAGYGITGSQAINPYQTLTAYSNANTSLAPGAISSGIILGNPGNKDLRWESTRQFDLGLDADFLKNRLNFSFDYYVKNTKDLLLDVPVPSYMGGGTVLSNVGAMKNTGYEFTLTAVPVVTKDFKWTSSFNISFLKNEVVSLVAGQDKVFTNSKVGAGLSTQSEFVLMPGHSIGSYWGLTYLGTWKPNEVGEAAVYGNKPGDSRYQDLNGDNKIDGGDYHIIGSGLPKYSWGWNNTATYKNFSLNVFVQAVGGIDKLDYLYGAGISASADIKQATFAEIKDRYIPGVNETSDIPAFSKTTKSYVQSTRFLEDGSFIRFKNISLSYDLPKDILKKMEVKLSVSGTNLFTITKYKGFDPETSSVTSGSGADINQSIDYGSYPNAKSVTVGVAVKF